MKGIDKARLLSGLLRAKGRYKRARSPTRPFIAYEISLLRQRLGMGTGLPEDVLERVQNNPVDMSKTLTPEEYTKQVQTWMPHSFVSLEGMNSENTKGAVKALQDVILRYPKIVDDDRGIRTFSTAWGFVKMSDSNRKRWKETVKEIIEREKLLEQVPGSMLEKLQRDEEEAFGAVPMSSRIGYAAACCFAETVTVIDVNLVTLPKVREAMSKFPIIREEFAKACQDAVRELWATRVAENKLWGESPDLKLWDGWTKLLELKGGESDRALAYQFGNSKVGGVVLLRDFRGEPIQWQYPKSVASGFSPKGTESDEPHGAGEAIIMHELGHALDRLLGIRKSREFQALKYGELATLDIEKEVSRYATTNNAELIAEAFCEYKLSKAPRPVAMAIGRMIDDAYEKKFGGPK